MILPDVSSYPKLKFTVLVFPGIIMSHNSRTSHNGQFHCINARHFRYVNYQKTVKTDHSGLDLDVDPDQHRNLIDCFS